MTEARHDGSSPHVERPPGDRLDSWKEIAAYMKRDVKTVQRWEKREGMPVHRHLHDKLGSVYAFRTDLDAWSRKRRPAAAEIGDTEVRASPAAARHWRWLWPLAGAAVVAAGGFGAWRLQVRANDTRNLLADAQFLQLTNFDGIEQAAALSPDGKLVAFQSNRDDAMDVWVTQIGSGQFYNLTRGAARDIVNPSVRTLGFSPDGSLVTFWARKLDAADQSEINIWAIPLLGGTPRPYLHDVAELDWTSDGARLAYHTPAPGDPLFVRDGPEGSEPKQIFSAPAGLHSHFPLWAPDQTFIYFVQGALPSQMDIWRIRPTGGPTERITNHDSNVSHPVFVNARTLMYLASDPDGAGPWIHSVDVERRISRRVSFGIDSYTSLAASVDGRRLVATRASPKGTLWRLPMAGDRANHSGARTISLTTGAGSSPRLGTRFLLYVSSRGTGDSIWKLADGRSTELWSAAEARIIGGPAIAPTGRRIAFTVRERDGQNLLYVANIDGTKPEVVAKSLELYGDPAWAPDEQAVTVAARLAGVPVLHQVFLDGRPPAALLQEHSVDPVWSPDGQTIVFSGADVGTTFPIKAAGADGMARPFPALTLTRGARRLRFLGGRSVVVLRGEITHKNLWSIDIATGAERQLTDFPPDFEVRDFDVSPDGQELVVEQIEDHADIVLLDLPPS
jgi:Tol biopolymer transport system component